MPYLERLTSGPLPMYALTLPTCILISFVKEFWPLYTARWSFPGATLPINSSPGEYSDEG